MLFISLTCWCFELCVNWKYLQLNNEMIDDVLVHLQDSPSPGSTPTGSDIMSVASSENMLQLREKIAITGSSIEDSKLKKFWELSIVYKKIISHIFGNYLFKWSTGLEIYFLPLQEILSQTSKLVIFGRIWNQINFPHIKYFLSDRMNIYLMFGLENSSKQFCYKHFKVASIC